VKASWKAKHSGAAQAHDVAVLGAGVTFQPVSFPPEDVQFVESRKFQIDEIARIYGIPPHMLFQTDRSTSWGTGIEQQGLGFVVYTLRPWLTRFEQRISRLLPNPQYVKFAVEGLLRGDTKGRYESYAIARNWGWMSVNEIRGHEDLPPIEGGDQYLSPLNMAPIGADPAGDVPPVDEETVDA
jgi:HK97 family phage portal protein